MNYQNLRLLPEFLSKLNRINDIIHNPDKRSLSETTEYIEGKYKLVVGRYECAEPTKHYWDYLEINVFKNDKLICTFTRNYNSFEYIIVTQNNTDFLITSEDYQAITIINLNTGIISTYGDWEAIKSGYGWCPLSFSYDPDEEDLDVKGCVWGDDYEILTIPASDLNNPDFGSAVLLSDYYYEECNEEYEDDF